MANAVVAVFDEYNEAQSTVNELLVAGFNENEVKLSAEDEDAVTDLELQRSPDEGGLKGFFNKLFGAEDKSDDVRLYDEAVRHGNYVVTAIAATDEKSELASEVMSHHHPVDLDERSTEWLGLEAQESGGVSADPWGSIPAIEEEVKVAKREVQRGGVRIFQRVSEVPIEEDTTRREEQMVVERTGSDTDPYRQHWQQTYGSEGGRYEEYSPAYEYGSTAASSTLYEGREWNSVEPELKSDWESRYPGSAWERFKDSVRHAFGGGRKY